jgi:TM2 domain-containing membrane protein YozV
MLQQQQSRSSKLPVVRRKSSPLIATLLSIVPGLGAAYNGQTSKAIVHFSIFASFFQMAVVTDGMAFFVLGLFGTLLFAAVDACRTAQLLRAGLAPDAEEDVIAPPLRQPLRVGRNLAYPGNDLSAPHDARHTAPRQTVFTRRARCAGRLHARRLCRTTAPS